MSMIDWIVGAEAVAATTVAIVAIKVTEIAIDEAQACLGTAVLYRAVANVLAARLRSEREANLFSTRPHRSRSGADGQETTKPG